MSAERPEFTPRQHSRRAVIRDGSRAILGVTGALLVGCDPGEPDATPPAKGFPKVESSEIPVAAYLTLPFREVDIRGQYDITEGWIYSQEEQAIHGYIEHGGVDIAVPYGTVVVAPADGYAMSSYHTFWREENGIIRMYQGKPLRFGLGNFVQMYLPSVDRFIQMAHLSDVDPAIPFSIPTRSAENWNPNNHTLKVSELKNHPMVVQVVKGQPLGRVGYSGLAFGYEDYQAGAQRPVQIDPAAQISWDEPHVHLEDFQRDSSGAKINQKDPYGLYSTREDYPTPTRPGKQGKNPLFQLGSNSLPAFAA